MCLPLQNLELHRISKGESAGFEFEIVSNRYGYLCGYVKVGPGHPWFEAHYDDVDVVVHGGLTFARHGKPCPTHGAVDEWWVGFDCAHAGDAPNPEIIVDPLERELAYRSQRLLGSDYGETFKDETYVRTECELLCIQAAAAMVPA